MRRGNNKGQEMEGKRKRWGVWGFYCFQLGLGVVIMAWRPAVFSSAPSPPSQSLTHLPNGFSVCCVVSTYGPARVPINGDLTVLCDIVIIARWNIFTFCANWSRLRLQDTPQLLQGSNRCRFHSRMICWNSRKPSKWNMCLQAVNQIGCRSFFLLFAVTTVMFYSLCRVSWGSDSVSTSCPGWHTST